MEPARRIQPFPVLSVAGVLAVVLIGASPVRAQTPPVLGTTVSSGTAGSSGVGVVAPPPTLPGPEFGFEESIPLEQGGVREESSYPERIRGVYAPAFVKSAVKTVRTSPTSGMRIGLSGWTATRIPFDDRNNSGGPAIGLTIEWGKPLAPPPEPVEPVPPAER
jgi:hypothetical protein